MKTLWLFLTEDDKGYIFYEVKFRKNPLSSERVDKEIAQVNGCGLDCYRYGFISRSGFAQELYDRDDLILISLEQMYK